MSQIYFDYHATTPALPEVIEAMQPYWSQHFGNPSSQHLLGMRGQMAVEKARKSVAQLIHAHPEQILFTSGATESIHTAIVGWTLKNVVAHGPKAHIITSTIEHKATYGACHLAQKLGARVTKSPVTSEGFLQIDQILEKIHDNEPTLISIIHGNNEIGTIQDLQELSLAIQDLPNVSLHVDAAQSLGKVTIDVSQLKIDFLSISGHKIYGPKGVGALYLREPSLIEPLFTGGGQEANLRAGTHNVTGIVGLGKACEWFIKNGEREALRLLELQTYFFGLLKPHSALLQINGQREHRRLPNNINFSLLKHNLNDLMFHFEDFLFSSGSACSSGNTDEASHVLTAIGVPEQIAKNTFRIGLGLNTTLQDIQKFCDSLTQAFTETPSQG